MHAVLVRHGERQTDVCHRAPGRNSQAYSRIFASIAALVLESTPSTVSR